MNWYHLASRFTRFMPCDRFRRQGPQYEQMWQEMMANEQQISIEEFLQYVDPTEIFDESMDEFAGLQEEIAGDDDAYFARSNMQGKPVFFMKTRGFEYIFTQ